LEKKQEEFQTRGSVAFIALQVEKNTKNVLKVFYGRNYANPLKLFKNNKTFMLSSEGSGDDIETHIIYSYDLITDITEKITKTICTSFSSYESDYGYNYRSYKDIDDEFVKDKKEKKKKKDNPIFNQNHSWKDDWVCTEKPDGTKIWKPKYDEVESKQTALALLKNDEDEEIEEPTVYDLLEKGLAIADIEDIENKIAKGMKTPKAIKLVNYWIKIFSNTVNFLDTEISYLTIEKTADKEELRIAEYDHEFYKSCIGKFIDLREILADNN
jgi:hypothetical protein